MPGSHRDPTGSALSQLIQTKLRLSQNEECLHCWSETQRVNQDKCGGGGVRVGAFVCRPARARAQETALCCALASLCIYVGVHAAQYSRRVLEITCSSLSVGELFLSPDSPDCHV